MALANYSDLQTSIGAWLNRTDLTAVIPDFISLAEAQHKRDLRLRMQISTTTINTVAGVSSITLPADFLELENLSVLTSPTQQLTYATVEQLDGAYPGNGLTGVPSLYTIEAGLILLGPTPDSVYSISCLYYANFPSLSSSSTNLLLTNYPSLYLYASLEQACLYLKDSQRAAEYKAMYERDVASLQLSDDMAQHSGSTLRVRIL